MSLRARGFTLVELLLVIAIIVLLLALSLPTIGRVRDQAIDVRTLAQLRTHAQTVSIYSTDWDDSYPHFTRRDAMRTIMATCDERFTFRYFENTSLWYLTMCGDPYLGPKDPSLWIGEVDEERFAWSFLLTASAIARPSYWNAQTRRADRSQWGTSRISEVTFPSQKALFTAAHGFGYPVPIRDRDPAKKFAAMAMTDASAGRYSDNDLVAPVPSGDGVTHDQAALLYGIYGVHTVDGVLGRDLK